MASNTLKVKDIIQCVKDNDTKFACKYIQNELHVECSTETLQKDISRTFTKYKLLTKSKSRVKGKENFNRFMDETYTVPKCERKSSEYDPTKECEMPLQDKTFLATDSLQLKAEAYKSVAIDVVKELHELRTEKENMEEELEVLIQEKDELNESVEKTDEQMHESKKKLKRTMNRETYWREKSIRLENLDSDDKEQNEIENLKLNVTKLKEELKLKNSAISGKNEEIDILKEEIDNLKHVENVELFNEQNKTYIPELHQCVYDILDCNVSHDNVPKVINSVLTLVNKSANKLPSSSTIQNWSVERAILSRRQASEQCDQENTTLYTDEASKYGTKWGAFATRDDDGNYVLLGLRDMATKSSKDTLDTFKEILSDIDNISDLNEAGNKILCNIKNTMSDRAATETKFNDLLAEYRETILPQVVENYNTMNEECQQAISNMNNFFCGLHTLVHMADVSQKSIYEVEKSHFDGEIPIDNPCFTKPGQPGTVRLIHTACKTFARRGDQRNGCHSGFSTFIQDFLTENKLLSLPLQPLKGSRFNILFVNAGSVFFLKEQMIDYLEKTNVTNGLLRSVLIDLKTPIFISGCKALGLISKLITTPLWKVIENKDITISMMNKKYLHLYTYLNDASNNLEEFIRGELVLFPDVDLKKDATFHKLVEQSPYDNDVVIILSVVLPALAKLIQRQYADHLPGGRHENVNEDVTASVDKHNKYPERVFSYVDHILGSKPNIKTLALEAHITFSLNKTSEWLAEREDKNDLIKQCRSEVKDERKRFKTREEFIVAKRREKQEEDFLKKAQVERKRIEKMEKETNDMLYFGLWQSEQQVTKELSEIKSKKEQEEALKAQLMFRKNVFKQQYSGSDNVYNFSKQIDGKRVNHSVEELKQNVLKLINDAYAIPVTREQPHLLVGKSVNHKLIEEGQSKWYKATVISQVLECSQ